ncbi:uncharacterized protein A4U43_C03F13510 [Asparagus officinalis]|uniref:Uncharacterized protein n=1 Tax=Asparagus officinalis TaxID=4686 RepID=A0A5P1FAI6_ASPOF|nr:uncharacterized protein A4U43_C03F13510 [Asparagus officinalis]
MNSDLAAAPSLSALSPQTVSVHQDCRSSELAVAGLTPTRWPLRLRESTVAAGKLEFELSAIPRASAGRSDFGNHRRRLAGRFNFGKSPSPARPLSSNRSSELAVSCPAAAVELAVASLPPLAAVELGIKITD